MALANGGYLHCTNIKNSCKFFSESDKKIGYSHLKNSGERSRVILALLFNFPEEEAFGKHCEGRKRYFHVALPNESLKCFFKL